MTQIPPPHPQTVVLVALFALVYLLSLLRKAARQQLDLYDFFMLSSVAVLPALLVLVPGIADWLAFISGVTFPFVVMFGLLFVAIFVTIHRLTIKVHRLEGHNRSLVQELSLLRVERDVPKARLDAT
jgi:hypothetical protein